MLLIEALAEACRRQPVEAKLLLAPSLRVGYQWTDRLARAGVRPINLRAQTVRGLALELAGPRLIEKDLTLLTPTAGMLLADQLWRALPKERAYLARIETSPSLAKAAYGVLRDLRLAGMRPDDVQPARFDEPVREKGREVGALLRGYLAALRRARMVDDADVFLMAADAPKDALRDAQILVADDPFRPFLEQQFLASLKGLRATLLPQEPAAPGSWPGQRGVEFFHAIGEVNEVREALRRCCAGGIPLDQVEVLYTDARTYVPLLHEVTESLRSEDGPRLEKGVPITFAEGLPARCTRPGKALACWAQWVRDDFPQALLRQMIEEGLLQFPETPAGLTPVDIADALRPIPIGRSRQRYLDQVAQHVARLEAERDEEIADEMESAERRDLRRAGLARRAAAARMLAEKVKALLDERLAPSLPPRRLLAAARAFVESHARADGENDQVARARIIEALDEMADLLDRFGEESSLVLLQWLSELPDELRVAGAGPQPGRLFAAPLLAGGHSGRPHTFILGMDDGRFPGAHTQDPILLDPERRSLSRRLPTADLRLEQKRARLAQTLARLAGRVTFSFSARHLADDREQFPSPDLMALWRQATGRPDADQTEMLRALNEPAAFAPRAAEAALRPSEWWLWRLLAAGPVRRPEEAIGRCHAHLRRGRVAARMRRRPVFTAFDGFVPQAGPHVDPATRQEAVSAGQLEQIGKCPLAYFFGRVLALDAPETYEPEADRWLPSLARGVLLHRLFQGYVGRLIEEKRRPAADDEDALRRELNEDAERLRERYPVFDEGLYRRDVLAMERVAKAFLGELIEQWTEYQPLFLEVNIGSGHPEERGSPLDTDQPVPVRLADGRTLRAGGRVDRVDLLRAGGDAYAVWDYKTGSAGRYKELAKDPFAQGRILQHALYVRMVEQVLRRRLSPKAAVRRSGYLLPGGVEETEGAVVFTVEQLGEFDRVLGALCDTVARGAFVPTDNEGADCASCDFAAVCLDTAAAAASGDLKIRHKPNAVLDGFRQLRRPDESEET